MKFKNIVDLLTEAGVPEPMADARILWRELSGQSALFPPKAEDESNSPALKDAIERRAKREPVQYILGKVGFYREEYEVSPDCLIPRQDTEILVDTAVRLLTRGARFIDLCTGSGCVAISTLCNTSSTEATAVDVSGAALEIAKRNAEKNGVSGRISFKELDLLTKGAELKKEGPFYAVLSNPPYVSPSAYSSLEKEIYREPKIAFLGGEDGTDFYRALIPLSKELIEKDGFIAFEIGFDQGELLRSLAADNGLCCEIIKDYSGCDRVALLRYEK